MIPWTDMDERERAVWSATVAEVFLSRFDEPDKKSIQFSMNLADRAVFALREATKKDPYR